MMNNPIVKILRFLIFFPICFIAFAIVNWGFSHLLLWFLGLSKVWFIVVMIFLAGTIWGLFATLSSLLAMLLALILPIKWLGSVSISILSLINGGVLCYNLWTIKEDYSGWEIFGGVVATILVLELTISLIGGAMSVGDLD
jgi:hypothetical protein